MTNSHALLSPPHPTSRNLPHGGPPRPCRAYRAAGRRRAWACCWSRCWRPAAGLCAKLVMLAAFAGTAPWTGLCLANGLIGFVILMLLAAIPSGPCFRSPTRTLNAAAAAHGDRDHGARRGHAPRAAAAAAPAARAGRAGAGDAFAVFILSDTPEHAAAAEEQAVAAFRAEDRDPARIHYRRRPANTGFKAGNIMDFLDHHADGFELMLTLDADSEMSADGGAAAGARHAGRTDAGDRAASDGRTAGLVRLPAAVPVRHARRHAHLGDRAGLVAGRRRPLLGPQRRGPHRAVPGALPAAAAARRTAHPVARPDRGGDAARRRLGRPRAAGRGRLVGGQPAGAAGIPPPRAALAGRQPAIPASAAPAGAAPDGPLATDPGDPAVRRHAALSAVPARRRGGGRDRRRPRRFRSHRRWR